MGGLYGVSSVKKLMTTTKFGAIAIFQAVAKDGIQASDFLAPLRSKQFQESFKTAITDVVHSLPELTDLDTGEYFELGSHAWECFKDVRTEFRQAADKVRELRKLPKP